MRTILPCIELSSVFMQIQTPMVIIGFVSYLNNHRSFLMRLSNPKSKSFCEMSLWWLADRINVETDIVNLFMIQDIATIKNKRWMDHLVIDKLVI